MKPPIPILRSFDEYSESERHKVMKTWTRRLSVVLVCWLALFLVHCSSSEADWSRAEFEAWYAKSLPGYPNLEKVMYRGSDANHHYFLMRPVDWFIIRRVPRAELVMEDERPYAGGSGAALGYYQVDVLHGFKKEPSP